MKASFFLINIKGSFSFQLNYKHLSSPLEYKSKQLVGLFLALAGNLVTK